MNHAKLSPSASARWLACPGSVEANWGAPRVDNKYSINGTTAHKLLEVCLRTGVEPDHFTGGILARRLDPIDGAMVDGVGYALDWVAAYMAAHPKAVLHVESRVGYDQAIGLPDDADVGFGFPDVQIANGVDELVTLDYKHGVGVNVPVENNSQLMLYAAGHSATFVQRFKKHRSVIVQPRAVGRKPVQEATYTDANLTRWLEQTVKPAVSVIMRDGKNAPREAGAHCRYCVDDGKCQAQFGAVQAAAAKEFANGAAPATPAQYAAALDTIARIKPLMASIEAAAVAEVHAGKPIPGYTLAWGQTRRQWADERAAETLLINLGLGDARNTVSLVSPAQAEAALKAAGKWPKKVRGEKPSNFTPLDSVIVQSAASPTIKKLADKADTPAQ